MQTTYDSTYLPRSDNALAQAPWAQVSRSPITSDKFRLLFKRASSEWKGILMLARYCGLDLIDCARLRRLNLTADRNGLRLFAGPNGRIRKVPLGPRLTNYFRTLSLGTPDTPLFPKVLSEKAEELEAKFIALVTRGGPGNTKSPSFCSLYYNMPPTGVRLPLNPE